MSDMNPVFIDEDGTNGIEGTSLEHANLSRIFPSVNAQHKRFLQPSNARRSFFLKADTAIKLIIAGVHNVCAVRVDTVFDAEAILDLDVALLPGRDYYVYACLDDADPRQPGFSLKVSLNSTFPDGFDEQTSRKIGGFHTLCVDAGTIIGHPLSGFRAGDILPASIWCLTHRPWPASPEGMVYIDSVDCWVDIYMQSGTRSLTKSVFGATVIVSRSWDDHNEDMFLVGKALLSDAEFSAAMEGSNQRTAIAGAANPVTTGGKLDSVSRRMISDYGVEDGCGTWWQWIDHPSANGGSTWGADSGGKGALHGSSFALLAGGGWNNAAHCGSRCRGAHNSRTTAATSGGGRGRARSL